MRGMMWPSGVTGAQFGVQPLPQETLYIRRFDPASASFEPAAAHTAGAVQQITHEVSDDAEPQQNSDAEWGDFADYMDETTSNAPAAEPQPAVTSLMAPVTAAAAGLPAGILHLASQDFVTVDLDWDKCVGEGSFAQVWKCTMRSPEYPDGILVAVKVAKDQQDLQDEARLQAICAQGTRYVVPVYAICYSNHTLLMEYCSGGSLKNALELARNNLPTRDGQPHLRPWPIRLKLLQEAAAALAHIHNCNHTLQLPSGWNGCVLHNDLRADNCVLARDGDGWTLKVTDFGLACRLQAEAASSSVTRHTHALWVAPEVLRGFNGSSSGKCCEATRAADVYSFGALMYEVLTGLHPHFASEDELHECPQAVPQKAWQVLLDCCVSRAQEPWQLKLSRDVQLLPLPGAQWETMAALLNEQCCHHNSDHRCTADQLVASLDGLHQQQEYMLTVR